MVDHSVQSDEQKKLKYRGPFLFTLVASTQEPGLGSNRHDARAGTPSAGPRGDPLARLGAGPGRRTERVASARRLVLLVAPGVASGRAVPVR